MLFAFLLAVPFQQRFHQATSFQRNAYFVTVSAALVSTGLLIAPSAYHRLNFPPQQGAHRPVRKPLRIAGIGVLAIAMVSVMVLIRDVVFGGITEIVIPTLSAALLIVLWMAFPLRERSRALARERADQRPS